MSLAALIPAATLAGTLGPRLLRWCAQLAPPPAPRDLLTFARSLRVPGDHGPEPLSFEHPAQVAMWEALARGRYKEFLVLGPSQDGKTLAATVVPLLWVACERGLPVALCGPDLRLVKELWRDKVLPVLRASGLAGLLPSSGAGAEDGVADSLLLANGARVYLLASGAKSQSGQAMRTCYAVFIEELDDVRRLRARKFKERTQSYGDDYLVVMTTTIKANLGSLGWETWQASTGASVRLRCPTCGAYWSPTWHEHVSYDDADHERAAVSIRLRCPAGHPLDEVQRQDALRQARVACRGQEIAADGGVSGAPPPAEVWGIRWPRHVSPRASLPRLARQIVSALRDHEAGDPSGLEAFYQDTLAEPWLDAAQTLRAGPALLADKSHRALHLLRCAPAEDGPDHVCTAFIDVQHRRLYFLALIYAWRSARWWIVHHGMVSLAGEMQRPTEREVHAALDGLWHGELLSGYPRPSGALVVPSVVGVDVADGTNPNRAAVISWVLTHPGCYPCHGQADRQSADLADGACVYRLPGVLSLHRQARAAPPYDLVCLAADQLKACVVRDLLRPLAADSHVAALPRGETPDGWLIRELCAEQQEPDAHGHLVWRQIARHNHRLDCAAGALGLARWLTHQDALAAGLPGLSPPLQESSP